MKMNADTHENTKYIYCMIRFSNATHQFSYITDDASIKEGDFVKVPFGKNNRERIGLVMRIIHCTEENAPYPPEKTKLVIEKTERPEDWDVPKPKKTATKKDTDISPKHKNGNRSAAASAEYQNRNRSANPVGSNENAASECMYTAASSAVTERKKSIPSWLKKLTLYIAVVVILVAGANWIAGSDDNNEQTPSDDDTDLSRSYYTLSYEERERIEEEVLEEVYSGRMPEEGMPMRALKYTTLGEPDKMIKNRDYDKMDETHKQITVEWYQKDGTLLASGLCFKLRKEQEFTLYSFAYFDPNQKADPEPDDNGKVKIPWNGIREDYDNPEDLWEENRDDYEDEDEAWDEWYDDGDEPFDE